jgi:hypothetical protein
LEKLSLDEHERILFDIHGICCAGEDDSETFIVGKLEELEACLKDETKEEGSL